MEKNTNLIKTINYKHKLSETRFLEDFDFNSNFKLSIDAPTGSGKSYYLLDYLKKNKIPFLFATDTLFLMNSLANRHAICYYCATEKESFNEQQLITVYQHIPKFINRDMTLIIDEAHSLVTDYEWRKGTVENTLTFMQGFKRVIFLSGTPVLSEDEAYKGTIQIKAIPDEIQNRELEVVRYKDIVGAIITLSVQARNDGFVPVISYLDKSDGLNNLRLYLEAAGFKKIALINSLTIKKTGGENIKDEMNIENDIEINDNPTYHEQLMLTGKVDADVIITTYRQGYDIKGNNYRLIIAPSKNRQSYTDIVQMINRFRDMPEIKSYLLSNGKKRACKKDVDYKLIFKNKLRETAEKAIEEIKRLTPLKDSYRSIKLNQLLFSDIHEYIYDREYVNYQAIANSAFKQLNYAAYSNLEIMKIILSTFNIKMTFSKMEIELETDNMTKNGKEKEDKKEINFMINLFYQQHSIPAEDGIPISFNGKDKLFYKIQDCHERLIAIGLKPEYIKKFLLENMIPTRKLEGKIECLIIKHAQDPGIVRYRDLLLASFNIGERLTSEEIAGRISTIREKCNYPPLKEKTAVEFFNRIFRTKRCRGEKDGKSKREIIEKF